MQFNITLFHMDKMYWPNVAVAIPIKDNQSMGKFHRNDCSRVLCVISDCETRLASVLLVGKKGQSDNVWSLWKFMVKRIT